MRARFWEKVPLAEMTAHEWEALCDNCGKCCLLKLEDEDTGGTYYTDVACHLFDASSCRCSKYAERARLVSGCVQLSPDTIADAAPWMPGTCAYRRLYEGKPLAPWHPLLSGTQATVATAPSLLGLLAPEDYVADEDLEDHIVDDALIHGEAL